MTIRKIGYRTSYQVASEGSNIQQKLYNGGERVCLQVLWGQKWTIGSIKHTGKKINKIVKAQEESEEQTPFEIFSYTWNIQYHFVVV